MDQEEKKDRTGRIPRGALAVVAVGLICTLAVLGLDRLGGGTSAELEWTTTELIDTPPTAKVGKNGEFAMERTTLSAIGQNAGGEGESLFRIAGILRVNTNGQELPSETMCEFKVLEGEASIARTPGGRAAWPRPSNEGSVEFNVQKQTFPAELTLKFNAVGNDITLLPITDAINRYTNTDVRTTVSWASFQERVQSWIWGMPNGSGPSAALLGYAVVFKTPVKPEASIRCEATIGGKTVVRTARAVQQEWPLPEPDLDPEAEADSTQNVE